ncbi:MAG: hypothetical protein IPK59_13650 [Rhodospirillaceae bacterium]|nr:hypothetical protein [Rhodospirillaceae bacterium]
MTETSPSAPSQATIRRLKVSATRANRMSIDSYQCLQRFAATMPTAEAIGRGRHTRAESDRVLLFAAISREVAGLTTRISDELMFLCSMTIASGIIRGEVRQRLAKALDNAQPTADHPIDLRQRRLRRMPVTRHWASSWTISTSCATRSMG